MNITVILNSWGYSWFSFMQNSLIESTVVLLIVSLIWLAIHKRVGSQLGYYLFLLVLFKLLVPLEISVPQEWRYASPRHTVSEAVNWAVVQVQREPIREPASPTISPNVESRPSQPPILLSNMPPASTTTKTFSEIPMEKNRIEPLTWKAGLMLLWAAIVSALLLRLLWIQSKTQHFLKNSTPVDDRLFPIDWPALKRSAQIDPSLPLLENTDVSSPLVWGILRSCIIVPQNFASLLSPVQIQWVLLHEIGHVRRWDLPATLFQRVIQILFFWNPAVWIANRTIDRLREYACDDFALSITTASRKDCGEGLLNVVERAAMLPEPVTHALGLLDTKTHLIHRLRRILDPHRLVHRKLSLGAAALLVLVAAVVLPIVRAEQNDENVQSESVLQGKVMDLETQKPVPNAVIQLLSPPPKHPFLSSNPWEDIVSAETTSGRDGYYHFDKVPKGIYRIAAEADGYIKYLPQGIKPLSKVWIDEQHSHQVYDILLEQGSTARIEVIDESHRPIEKALIIATTNQMNGARAPIQEYTDTNGFCNINNFPQELAQVAVRKEGFAETVSPEFMPGSIENAPTIRVLLKKEAIASGTVTMTDGSPAKGVELYAYRWIYSQLNGYGAEPITTKTDESGHYSFRGLGEGEYRITASNNRGFIDRHYAPTKEVKFQLLAGERKNIDFSLNYIDPKGSVIGNVENSDGLPISNAKIEIMIQEGEEENFNYHQGFSVSDENGNFEISRIALWKTSEISANAFGYLSSKATYKNEDQPIRIVLQPAGRILGQLLDKYTGLPITNCVIYGEGNARFGWISRNDGGVAYTTTGQDGRFTLESLNTGVLKLVAEAPGYEIYRSPDIEIEASKTIENIQILLTKGITIEGKVINAEMQPVADAELGFLSKANIQNPNMIGFFAPSTLTDTVKTDAEGKFKITGLSSDGDELIVQHKEYAPTRILMNSESIQNEIIATLVEGCTVEGIIADAQGTRLAGARVEIFNFPENLFTYAAYSNEQGIFHFDHIPSAELYVRKSYHTPNDPNNNEQRIIKTENGKTIQVNFGAGAGAVIKGVVYKEGKPLARAQLCLQKSYDDSMRADQIITRANENGEYSFKGIPSGDWIIAYAAPSRDNFSMFPMHGDKNYQSITVDPDQSELTIDLQADALQLGVVCKDQDKGNTLEGVRITSNIDINNPLPNDFFLHGITKNNGQANFLPKAPRVYSLIALKAGYSTTLFSVEVPAIPSGKTISAVTHELFLSPSETIIELNLMQQGKMFTGTAVQCMILKEGSFIPTLLEPVKEQTGKFTVTGAPAGTVELKISASQENEGYQASVPPFVLKAHQPYTVMAELQKVLPYQIVFKKPVQGEAKIEIVSYPSYNQTQKIKPYGIIFHVPEGNQTVRIAVPGYKLLEIVPEKMATPENSHTTAVIEVELVKE